MEKKETVVTPPLVLCAQLFYEKTYRGHFHDCERQKISDSYSTKVHCVSSDICSFSYVLALAKKKLYKHCNIVGSLWACGQAAAWV